MVGAVVIRIQRTQARGPHKNRRLFARPRLRRRYEAFRSGAPRANYRASAQPCHANARIAQMQQKWPSRQLADCATKPEKKPRHRAPRFARCKCWNVPDGIAGIASRKHSERGRARARSRDGDGAGVDGARIHHVGIRKEHRQNVVGKRQQSRQSLRDLERRGAARSSPYLAECEAWCGRAHWPPRRPKARAKSAKCASCATNCQPRPSAVDGGDDGAKGRMT